MRIALARLEPPVRDKADAIARMAHIYEQAVADGADLVVFPELTIPKVGGNGLTDSRLIFSRLDLDRLAAQLGSVALLVGSDVRPLPDSRMAVFCLLDGAVQELECVSPREQIIQYRGQVIETMIFRNCWLGQEQIHEYYRPDKLRALGATVALDFFEQTSLQGGVLGVTAKSQPLTAYWHLLQRDANPVSDSGTIRAEVRSGARQISVQGDAWIIVDLVSKWPALLNSNSIGLRSDSSLILGCATLLPIKVGNAELEVEVQRNYLQHRTGMMYRDGMAEVEGMVFVYPHSKRATFYMRNTSLPLSCAYIDSVGFIQEIHDMEPFNLSSIRSRSEAIRFVLEVNQGWFDRHNVKVGTVVTTPHGSLGEYFFGAEKGN